MASTQSNLENQSLSYKIPSYQFTDKFLQPQVNLMIKTILDILPLKYFSTNNNQVLVKAISMNISSHNRTE